MAGGLHPLLGTTEGAAFHAEGVLERLRWSRRARSIDQKRETIKGQGSKR